MALKIVPQTKAACITCNLFCDIANMLQNKLNSDVAHFTSREKSLVTLFCCETDSSASGKARNFAIQLVLP